MKPILLWFRRNLRLRDNASLIAAVESGHPIIPVYVSDALDIGGASRWWLHHSLARLDKSLRDLGSQLVIASGAPSSVLPALIEQSGATALYYTRRYERQCRQDEEDLQEKIGEKITIEACDDSLLNHPTRVLTQSQTPYKVYTPFWRASTAVGDPPRPRAQPSEIPFARHSLEHRALTDLELLPTKPDWSAGLRDRWTPGENGALDRLDLVDSAAEVYADQRDRPDLDTTSRLSAHLHFGEISVRDVWHAVRDSEPHLSTSRGAEALLRQLYWRDFSAYLLYHFPELPDTPLRSEFEAFPWSNNEEHLLAWQQGKTGYPIVDAGMRQLWTTGWMHNRVRMIVASFLIKDLLIPWQKGADWFLDTLVDADLANNSAGWQWVAGCGTDSAPYFRIFNPTLQGKKFDPAGVYVRRWIPELAALSDKHIHEPWAASEDQLESAGVVLGRDYPEPVVDHGAARAIALEGYKSIRRSR